MTRFAVALAAGLALLASSLSTAEEPPLVVGLCAALSGPSAPAGEAILRGAKLALAEINERGGLLGRPVELDVHDNRGNPARGVDQLRALGETEALVGTLGGVSTPVAMAALPLVHEQRMIYLTPWAAGTGIVEHRFQPSYSFRLAASDREAARYLLLEAHEKGFGRPALLLEHTAWGRSNQESLLAAAAALNIPVAAVRFFHLGQQDFADEARWLADSGADHLILIAGVEEGAHFVRALAESVRAREIPVFSHWGIAAGNFPEQAGDALDRVRLSFLSTRVPWFSPEKPRLAELRERYCRAFPDCQRALRQAYSMASAHAYDLLQLLAMAVEQAGTARGGAVRDALERLPAYDGLLRRYDPPFTPERHDVLKIEDYLMARYLEDGGVELLP